MEIILSLLIGILYAGGVYLILRRSLVKVLIGLLLLGHAANLLIFTLGRLVKAKPAFITDELSASSVADPLPQALILTAIVIGFGVISFAVVLFKRAYDAVESDDIDNLNTTDSLEA